MIPRTHTTMPTGSLNLDELRAAVEAGNIPCLIPVLYQLTGDRRWLDAPYVPARTRGFEELNSGGLPEAIQAEIRSAAFEAISAWAAGTPVASLTPSDEELTALMSACMGEPVPADFAPMIAEQLGFRPFAPVDVSAVIRERAPDFRVAVIGAGISGLASAFALKKAGVPFIVFEKNEEIGGTWWENRYPGARVDIPTNLYSFSFAPKNWSEHFSQRNEIKDYLLKTAQRFDIRSQIRFGCEVSQMRWDETAQQWCLKISDQGGESREVRANAVITATGLHNRPKIPTFPGEDAFDGVVLHSARWSDNVSLTGKRVAVLGTGASAMQIVNAIAPKVENLLILQRSPQWVAPNENYFAQTSTEMHFLFDNVPFYREWYRFRLYWLYTERLYAALVVDPKWDNGGKSVSKINDVYRKFFTAYLEAQLEGREDLQQKSLPNYPPFGKRILLDNGWFRTLRQPNVELLTEGVSELTKTGLVTSSGETRQIDILVLCTGFEQQRFLFPMEIYGRGGRLLRDEWKDDDARAYLGITSPGFPNLFYLYGPNTNPPSGSYIHTAEAQVRYIVRLLTTMISEEIASVECRQEPFEQYNAELDRANGNMVYAQEGVHNYYRNAKGRVVTNSPWPVLQYWSMTREPDLGDFIVTPVRSETAKP
ncbi:flavin-containing monooxygenase [Burkholderia multivorans]|uniref:flavin-containing monooxygenase n=1 Tax=Burkholderia multivorans TaxID=87883 RepID=UPI0019CF53FA|nr:NAD(P)/FAD-dependent oxidoreductase [Burkholderia multivorans]